MRVVAVQCVDRCAATVGAGRGPAPRERGGEAHLRLVCCGWLARRVRRMELKQAQTLMGYRATTYKLERLQGRYPAETNLPTLQQLALTVLDNC